MIQDVKKEIAAGAFSSEQQVGINNGSSRLQVNVLAISNPSRYDNIPLGVSSRIRVIGPNWRLIVLMGCTSSVDASRETAYPYCTLLTQSQAKTKHSLGCHPRFLLHCPKIGGWRAVSGNAPNAKGESIF